LSLSATRHSTTSGPPAAPGKRLPHVPLLFIPNPSWGPEPSISTPKSAQLSSLHFGSASLPHPGNHYRTSLNLIEPHLRPDVRKSSSADVGVQTAILATLVPRSVSPGHCGNPLSALKAHQDGDPTGWLTVRRRTLSLWNNPILRLTSQKCNNEWARLFYNAPHTLPLNRASKGYGGRLRPKAVGPSPLPGRRPSAPNSQSLASRMITSEIESPMGICSAGDTPLNRGYLQPFALKLPGPPNIRHASTPVSDLIPNDLIDSNPRTKPKTFTFTDKFKNRSARATKNRNYPRSTSTFRKSLVPPSLDNLLKSWLATVWPSLRRLL